MVPNFDTGIEPGARGSLKCSAEPELPPQNFASGLSTPTTIDISTSFSHQLPSHAPTTGVVSASTSASRTYLQPTHSQPNEGYGTIPITSVDASLALLDAASHANALVRVNRVQEGKSTGPTYQRHVKRYEKWWNEFQFKETAHNPNHHQISPFPITATRVAIFLEHETKREKVSNASILFFT